MLVVRGPQDGSRASSASIVPVERGQGNGANAARGAAMLHSTLNARAAAPRMSATAGGPASPEERAMTNRWRCAAAVAAMSGWLVAGASAPSVTECFEGSDFIVNAAHARESGMRRADFLARLEEDFMLIQAFPPELRWFAKDADDERLLLEAARDVFDAPAAPEDHRARFLAVCFARASL
jgi:hypothetical protein